MRIVSVETAEVFVPEGRRPLEKDKIMSLANSMAVLGLVQPITVSYKGSRIRLVAGHGRLAAAKSLGWKVIDAVVIDGDDVRLRLAEIAENLHRAELTALERDELTAEWIALTEADQKVLRQSDAKPKGGRPEGGVRAAARELKISEPDARRALKVASLSPQAKQAAREDSLDDNRTALLTAAEEASPEKQVEAVRAHGRQKKKAQEERRRKEMPGQRPTREQSEREQRELLEKQQRQRAKVEAAIAKLIENVAPVTAGEIYGELCCCGPQYTWMGEALVSGLHQRSQSAQMEGGPATPEPHPLDIPEFLRRSPQ